MWSLPPLTKKAEKEETFLLESGRRFQQLDFSKDIQTRLAQLDWGPLELLAKEDVTAAHTLFTNTILPVIEDLVPKKVIGKRFGHSREHKQRRCLWRKLGRTRKRLLTTSSVPRATVLLRTQQTLERKLKSSYDRQGWEEENKVVNAMKSNVKAFYAYGRARHKTKARVGPFIDPATGVPNPDPDYAAQVLSEQYSSVFTTPRSEYVVDDVENFFSGGTEWRMEHEGRPLLQDIKFSEQDIEWACKELKSSSSPGPDGVPAVLLKQLARNYAIHFSYCDGPPWTRE